MVLIIALWLTGIVLFLIGVRFGRNIEKQENEFKIRNITEYKDSDKK